jgi:hypothetical protein
MEQAQAHPDSPTSCTQPACTTDRHHLCTSLACSQRLNPQQPLLHSPTTAPLHNPPGVLPKFHPSSLSIAQHSCARCTPCSRNMIMGTWTQQVRKTRAVLLGRRNQHTAQQTHRTSPLTGSTCTGRTAAGFRVCSAPSADATHSGSRPSYCWCAWVNKLLLLLQLWLWPSQTCSSSCYTA